MGPIEFLAVLHRYPFLQDGLPDHRDEVLRLAERLIVAENTPTVAPDLPADAPAWERRYWARRHARDGL
jgi:hypothetical protein